MGASGPTASGPSGPERLDFLGTLLARIAVVLVAVVAARLIWLQVIDAPSLAAAAQARRTNVVTLEAKRGTIYDRSGRVLAVSVDCTTIYCNPQEVSDAQKAAQILAEDLGGSESSYLTPLTAETSFSYVSRKADASKADKVKDDLKDEGISGFYYLRDTKRSYPHGDVGGQVLGIVGVDGDGLSGLELYYDQVLRGTDGQMTVEAGADGTPIAGGASTATEAQDGTDIVISVDVDIQEAAEKAIREGVATYKAESGSVVITDPRTGEILAACSTPLLTVTDTSSVEEGATELKPVSSSYEPGSIFKLLTMSIAIEDGLVTPDTAFRVPAKVKVGADYVGDDDNRDATMVMTTREILRRSSNAGTALVAQEVIGASRFAEGIDRFGIGHATGVDFPGESAGMVTSLDQYTGASLGAMSFGQSLAIPMVQMVKAVGSLANGGTLETPHFLLSKGGQKAIWESPGTSVSAQTAAAVTDMMRTVVQEGTAQNAQVKGCDIAGKTGTGEQADEKGGYIAGEYVSSMIGFAPASDPQVLVYVGLNGTPYLASSSATKVFSTVMSATLTNRSIQPGSAS